MIITLQHYLTKATSKWRSVLYANQTNGIIERYITFVYCIYRLSNSFIESNCICESPDGRAIVVTMINTSGWKWRERGEIKCVQGRVESHMFFYNDKALNRWGVFDCRLVVKDNNNDDNGHREMDSRNVENTCLRLVFSTFLSSSQMPFVFYHSVIHGLASLFVNDVMIMM